MFEAKNIFVGALLMLRKFTIFNIKFYADIETSDYIFGVFLLPILGFAIGLTSLAISVFKYVYEPMFVGALLFVYYCIITKSSNILDTYKTINVIIRPKGTSEQILGTIAITCLSILYFSLFSVLSIRAVMITPMVGFCSLLILNLTIKRSKANTSILKYCNKNHAIFAFIFSFTITAIISTKLIIALSLTYIISAIIMNYFDLKVKVLPSSIEGFIIEISQILFLFISYTLFLYK